MTQVEVGGRFIRAGFWLVFLGFVMSFGMVLHYVVGARYDTGQEFLKNVTLWYACPWTLSTAVVLGGSLGMVAIGAVYAILGKMSSPAPATTRHLRLRRGRRRDLLCFSSFLPFKC